MSYEPTDHALEPRQALAAWAIFAALLVMALGASISRADFHDRGGHETLLARSGGAGVGSLSHGSEKTMTINAPVCADNSLS